MARTRLFSFRSALTNAEFKEVACPVCARIRREAKLKPFSSPSLLSHSLPAWCTRTGITNEQWNTYRTRWIRKVDGFLSCKAYMLHFLEVPRRIMDVLFMPGAPATKADGLELARARHIWKELCSYGVPSLYTPGDYWLLYFPPASSKYYLSFTKPPG